MASVGMSTVSMDKNLSSALVKLQQAKIRSAKFSSDIQAIDEEKRRLDHQLKCLTAKRLLVRGQYDEWLNDTNFHRTIVPYSKAWNQRFAAQLQAHLPCEIRNMIYEYLWWFDSYRTSPHKLARSRLHQHHDLECPPSGPDTITQYPWLLDIAQLAWSPTMTQVHNLCFTYQHQLPHYLSPEYVGSCTATEVGQSLYQALNQAGLLACGTTNLGSLLNHDPFHLGLVMTEEIKNLTIHCKIDRYRKYHRFHYSRNHPDMTDTTHIRTQNLEKDFKPLLNVKKKQGLKLHILLYQRNIRLNVLDEVILAVTEILQTLQQNGACITISWTYRGHWTDPKGPPCGDIVQKDITEFFNMPRAAWEYNMKRLLKQVDHLIQRRHKHQSGDLDTTTHTIEDVVENMWHRIEHEYTTDDEDAFLKDEHQDSVVGVSSDG